MSENTSIEVKPRYLGKVGNLVDRRVHKLQTAFVGSDESWSRATLAKLREAIQSEPGTVPEIWEWTQCPVDDRASDEPTYEERAVHAAMCLYALHQQGRLEGMHRSGRGLGAAVRVLTGPEAAPDSAVRRRFAKILTATSMPEALHHLRGLVTQFRSAQPPIALDYGMLADDLYTMQFPDGLDTVALRWSRQYYRVFESESDPNQEENK